MPLTEDEKKAILFMAELANDEARSLILDFDGSRVWMTDCLDSVYDKVGVKELRHDSYTSGNITEDYVVDAAVELGFERKA